MLVFRAKGCRVGGSLVGGLRCLLRTFCLGENVRARDDGLDARWCYEACLLQPVLPPALCIERIGAEDAE